MITDEEKIADTPHEGYKTENQRVFDTYQRTAAHYDEWNVSPERNIHSAIRQSLLPALEGKVIEIGVGTGESLPYYTQSQMDLIAIDLSIAMLEQAQRKCPSDLHVDFQQGDASVLSAIENNQFDYYVAFFVLCVMPKSLLPLAIDEMARVLKTGGHFYIVDIVQAKNESSKSMQENVNDTCQVKERYCLDVTNNSLDYIKQHPSLRITQTLFVHSDTYLLIEGEKIGSYAGVTKK